jgi:hypothetical protein
VRIREKEKGDFAMGKSGLADVVEPGKGTFDRVIDTCVLSPIPGENPAGKDPRLLSVWGELKRTRPMSDDSAYSGAPQSTDSMGSSWHSYRDKVELALCTQSKDLELGLVLAEACTRIHGFPGLRDGLWAIRGLITNFKDKGLFPEAVDGDYGIQLGKLDAIDRKLTEAVRQIPLTMRKGSGANYDLNYRDEARRSGGMITAAEFDAAASAGSQEQYDALLASVAEANAELDELKSVIAESYGSDASSLSTLSETVEEFKTAIRIILHRRYPSPRINGPLRPEPPPFGGGVSQPPLGGIADRDSWAQCEELVRKGDIGSALALMTRLAASEPNGRVRFHRKLVLADLCLQTNREQLGASILEELNETIELHKLESWENSDIVGGVWSRLVRCYRDKNAGTANEGKEAEFYSKLTRLDPWQALSCGEPERKKE